MVYVGRYGKLTKGTDVLTYMYLCYVSLIKVHFGVSTLLKPVHVHERERERERGREGVRGERESSPQCRNFPPSD